MKIRFPVSANAKTGMIRSVVLNIDFKKTASHLDERVGFSLVSSVMNS